MDIFTTGVLRRVLAELRQPTSFLLDLFFPLVQEETSEEIHFDIDQSKPRITPFVSPMRAGRVVEEEGFRTGTFKPAYAKDKRKFDPSAPLKRAIGEQVGGNLDPMQRRQIALRRAMENQLAMLTRREEVMASEALRTGKVTVKGDGYPTTVVDFQRDAALSVTLAGTDRWDQNDPASDPVGDLETWSALTQTKGGGAPRTVVMAPDTWQSARTRLIQRDEARALFEYARGSQSQAELGPRAGEPYRHVGRIGDFDVWTYDDVYIDDDGVEQHLMPSGELVLGSSHIEGTRCYAAIQDEKAGYAAIRYHIKSWLEEDPAVRWLLLQSAPLVVPYRPNASFRAKVK